MFNFLKYFLPFVIYPSAAWAATITTEKNCAVRIEGEAFTKGQFVGVYKGSTSEKPIARIKILRIDPKNADRAIGRVLRKPGSSCANLKGLIVAPLSDAYLPASAKTGAGGSKSSSVPKIEFSIDPAYVMVSSSSGLHTQSDEVKPVEFKLMGIAATFDAFPIQFSSNSFVAKALGLGIRYNYLMTLKEIAIETTSGEQTTQKTSGSTLATELIFRIPYSNDALASEFRIFYAMESLKNVISKKLEDLTAPPIRDVNFSGVGFRFLQRWHASKIFRMTVGGHYTYGLGMTSPTSYNGATEEQTSTYSGATGFGAQVNTDFLLGMVKIGMGYRFENRKANNKLELVKNDVSPATKEDSNIKLNYGWHEILFSLGLLF